MKGTTVEAMVAERIMRNDLAYHENKKTTMRVS